MARVARVVCIGVPHHVTQRGNHQADVFFSSADRRLYLKLLAELARQHHLRLLAYCLMSNHVHLVALPEQANSMAKALGRTHCRYAQYVNAARSQTGHLWQNRFYSCPLGPTHLWAVVRYVERNPVRAQLVASAPDYEWSSARAHLTSQDATGVLDMNWWQDFSAVARWADVLEEAEDEQQLLELRRCTLTGRPWGSEEFIADWERNAGRPLCAAPGGRPKRPRAAPVQLELEEFMGNT